MVESFQRVEHCILLDLAPLYLLLTPPRLPLLVHQLVLLLLHLRRESKQGFLPDSNFLDVSILAFLDFNLDIFLLGIVWCFRLDNNLDLRFCFFLDLHGLSKQFLDFFFDDGLVHLF